MENQSELPLVVRARIKEYFSIINTGMTTSNKSRSVTEKIMKNLDQALQHLAASPNNEVDLAKQQGKDKEMYILERLAIEFAETHPVHGDYLNFPTEFGKPHRLYFKIDKKPFKVTITRVEEYS